MAASTEEVVGSVALPQLTIATVAVAELIADPSFPVPEAESYEMTHTDLTDGHKTFKQGWVDGGEVSFVFNYREDTYSQLLAHVFAGTLACELTWTDPGQTTTDPKIAFNAFVTSGPAVISPLNDRWTIELTMKITGKPVFTEGTTV